MEEHRVCLLIPNVNLLTHLLTYYLLTQWNRILLQKLAGSQLVKNLPAFYVTRRFITASHEPATCPSPEPEQSSPLSPFPTSCRSILILSSHLRLGLQIGFFPTGFPTKTLCTPILPTKRATCPGHSHSSWCDDPKNIWWEVQIIKIFSMRFSPLPCYLVPVRPKCIPHHPILEHP